MTQENINARFGTGVLHRIYQDGKVGSAAGWTVGAAADSYMATVAASQSAGMLIVPLWGLHVGDLLMGYHLVGQIDSAGNAVTVDCDIYESLAVAAASTHTAKTGTDMTQLSVTADTKMSALNVNKDFAAANRITVLKDAAYFARIDVTTNGTTDLELLAFVLHLKEVKGA